MEGSSTSDHGECLSDEIITEYLEGVLDAPLHAASEVHLISCDHCRQLLAIYMRVMKKAVTADEEVAVAAASVFARQREFPEIARASVFGRKILLSMLTLAAVVVFGFALWNQRRTSEPRTAGEVVRLLLDRSRPFELRLDEESYLPILRTRGPEDASVDYGLLAGEMTRLSADAYALGRFYLVQKNFDEAVPQLETAEREFRTESFVHNDLGVAYMERGGEINQGKGAEEFQHALQANPESLPAIFNLGIFYERLGDVSRAEVQWRRYLQLDATSGWAEEVRSKLGTVSR